MQKAYQSIRHHIKMPPSIHIVGTNGKGSTGRFLAGILKESGLKVGHYTSPHILDFRERIWIDGAMIEKEQVEAVHQRALHLLKDWAKELSYFEYTTFLAAIAFEGLDMVVMEAGLGGEFDATAVIDHRLTLVTPIDYDHQDFLGSSIQKIAATKLRAVEHEAILAPQIHEEVYSEANRLGIEWKKVSKESLFNAKNVCLQSRIPTFFATNLALAYEGAKRLGIEADMSGGIAYRLPGRFQKIGNVLLDVGHNPLSARAIAQTLEKRIVLVYNSYEDKEYEEILKILKPKIKRVELLPIQNDRIAKKEELERVCERLGLACEIFDGFDEDEEYLVYGSFSVVEEIAKKWLPNFMNI